MAGRDMLAQLFLGGRSPEEQQARILKQRHDAGLSGSGGAFPSGPPGNAFPPGAGFGGADMSQPGPWGAGQDPMSTGGTGGGGANVPIPTPRPDPFSLPDTGPVPTPSPGPPMGGMINPQQGAGMANGPIGSIGGPQNGPIGSIGGPQNAPIGSTQNVPPELLQMLQNAPIGSIAQNAQPRVPEPQLDPLMLQRGQMRQQSSGGVPQNAQTSEAQRRKDKTKKSQKSFRDKTKKAG